MTVTLRVLDDRGAVREARAEEGQTVLEAALAAGIEFPHDCQAGNCAACKCELVDGDVMMLSHSEYALTAEENERKLVLGCRAQVWSDCTVRPLPSDETAVHPSRILRCKVVGLDDLTHDVKRVRLSIEAGGPYTYSAGQYAKVRFGGAPERSYSMANPPGPEGLFELHIRKVPDGRATAHVFGALALGDGGRAEGPHGGAFLREKHTGPIIAVGGGTGYAPLRSIVLTALARNPARAIHVYFGARAERDVYGEQELRTLAARHPGLRVSYVLSDAGAVAEPGRRRTGFVGDAVAQDFTAETAAGAKAYVAGPPPMVDHVQRVLGALGVPARDVHTDPFYSQA